MQMADEPKITTEATALQRTAVPAGPRGASVVHIYGSELGKRHMLSGEMTIGRDDGNHIVVVTTSASRTHARLFEHDGVWNVEDLGSTNGTYVNGREIREPTRLSNGDLLKLGGVVLKFLEGGNIEGLYHEAIHRMAILDGLTGVHNKRALIEFLDRELARAVRHERPLCLAMFDIDNFKEINDTHGHLVGDHVLLKLAALVSRVVRKDELLARFGGEEFVVVLPETSAKEAVGFAERIRAMVEEHEFRFDAMTLRLTISVGVAFVHYGYNVEQFLDAADKQLYQAKTRGRNQVVSEL